MISRLRTDYFAWREIHMASPDNVSWPITHLPLDPEIAGMLDIGIDLFVILPPVAVELQDNARPDRIFRLPGHLG